MLTHAMKNMVIHELISAQSALNMPPTPIQGISGEYLSESDKWASVAYDHIMRAMKILTNTGTYNDRS
jgi:hypothetical protein